MERCGIEVSVQVHLSCLDRLVAEPKRDHRSIHAFLQKIHRQRTYWYLSGAPELMTLAMGRLERRWGDAS